MHERSTLLAAMSAVMVLAGCGSDLGAIGTRGGQLAGKAAGWIRYPDAPSARFAAAGATSGFRLLVLGGYDDGLARLDTVEQFTAFDRWEALPPLPTRRSSPCAAQVPAERILVFGGAVPGGVATQPLGTVERLGLADRKWDRLADMPTPRWGAAAVARGLFVYVAGGNSWGHPTAAFERYDARTDTWQTLPKLPIPREGAAIAALGERIVVAGGSNHGDALDDVQVYNPETRTWTPGAPMPTARSLAGYAVYGHHLFVVGGLAQGKAAAVESYDLGTNTWTVRRPLPEPLSSLVAARLGERLVVTGGNDAAGQASARTWGLPFEI